MYKYSPVQWGGIKNDEKYVVSGSVLNCLSTIYAQWSRRKGSESLRRREQRDFLSNHVTGGIANLCSDLDDWELMEELDSYIKECNCQ